MRIKKCREIINKSFVNSTQTNKRYREQGKDNNLNFNVQE